MVLDADHNLATEQFRSLNERFYQGRPHDYVRMRMRALMLVVGASTHVDAALREGVKFGTIEISVDGDVNPDVDEAERWNYAAMESVVLLHQTTESFFRLLFAHLGSPGCPWLEVARQTDFRAFRKSVSALSTSLENDDTLAEVLLVMRGHGDRHHPPPDTSQEAWRASTDGLKALLGYASHMLLSDSGRYNAAKHGLAVVPSDMALRLSSEGTTLIEAEGRCLVHLERRKATDRWQWNEVTSWESIERNLSLTYFISTQIESLWTVARVRYLNERDGQVIALGEEALAAALRAGRGADGAAFGIDSAAMTLAYYADDARGEGNAHNLS